MSGYQQFQGNRFFCGLTHRRPLHVWLLDHFGWHQELYRVMGSYEVHRRWVRSSSPGRSVYTCRKRMDHWRVTIKPPGEREVVRIHDRDFSEFWLETANKAGVKNRNTPFWRKRIRQRTRDRDVVKIPTPAWELGHKFAFTRWEAL